MKPQDQLQIPVWSHEKEMLSGVLGTASFLDQMNCGWWSMSLENRSPRWKLPLVLSGSQLVFPEREIKEKKKNWKYFLGSSTRVKMLTKMSWGKQQAQHNTTQHKHKFNLCCYFIMMFFATNFQQMIPVPIPKIKKVSITMDTWIPGWAPIDQCKLATGNLCWSFIFILSLILLHHSLACVSCIGHAVSK